MWLNDVLLMLHFLGLAMGLAGGFGNLVMSRLIAQAKPSDAMVLARFPSAIVRVSDIGLVLLWVTGVILIFSRFDGLGNMPLAFWIKIVAVVALTGLVGFMHTLMAKAKRGDAGARARLPKVGPFAMLSALLAIVFAVLAFH
ncbi:MAG: hypothetical protein GY798_06055 [Hyphomicrobiales bacterium]|nr:hypothetical protein [Hyphomicrobiales bacterium]